MVNKIINHAIVVLIQCILKCIIIVHHLKNHLNPEKVTLLNQELDEDNYKYENVVNNLKVDMARNCSFMFLIITSKLHNLCMYVRS